MNETDPYETDRQAAETEPRDDRPITDFLWSVDAPGDGDGPH